MGTPLSPVKAFPLDVKKSAEQGARALIDAWAQPGPNMEKFKKIFIVLVPVLLVAVAALLIAWIVVKNQTPNDVDPQNVRATEKARQDEINTGKSKEGFLDAANKSLYSELIRQLDPSERYFVNLCPLTAMWAGYIGPVQKGVFSPKFYVKQALDAGIRSFVLPISWHKNPDYKPPQWPEQLAPGCMVRDDNDIIISINGMTVRQFVNELFIEIGNHGVRQSDEPILLTFLTTSSCPDRIKQEADYVRMMCKIGQELSSVSAFMSRRLATIGSYGSATGGAREQEILMQVPLEEFRSKVLVFTDFDTKLVLKDAYKDTRVFTRPSLYDFVNIHLHKDPSDVAKPGQVLNGKMIHMMDIKGSKTNWTDGARTVWVTTLGDGPIVASPPADLVNGASTVGIQMIPIPFFVNKDDDVVTKEIWKQWNGFSWRLKPPIARYAKPPQIVPAKPSAALNARVATNLQPGQTQIT